MKYALIFAELMCAFAMVACAAGNLYLGWSEVPFGIFGALFMISDVARDMKNRKSEHCIAHY